MRRRWFMAGVVLAGCDPKPERPRFSPAVGPREVPTEVLFEERLGQQFVLIRLEIWLDKEGLGSWGASEAGPDEPPVKGQTLQVGSALLAVGGHVAQARAVYRGHGYGVFSYLSGYKFDVRSSHEFEVQRGQRPALIATCRERGGITTPLEERPVIEWRLTSA